MCAGAKRLNYTTASCLKAVTFAYGMCADLTTALHDHPVLAKRLGCEPLEVLAEREAESVMQKLTPFQRQRLARRRLDGDAEGDGHGVA
jgi:hypothetical protein